MPSNLSRGLAAIALVFGLALALPVSAATFHVDPVNGSAAGDGSADHPWRTMQQVVEDGLIAAGDNSSAPVRAGDTLLLRDGYHGEIILDGYINQQPITVEAAEGHTPQVKRVSIKRCAKWTFRGLTISPSFAPVYEQHILFDVYSRFIGISRYITIEDCFLYSVLDASGWSAADWVNKACSGIRLGESGVYLTARNNRMLNVDFGIFGQSNDSLVEYNEVTNFAGDGIRATGNRSVYQYNLIRNCYDVDDNHDDGIQGFRAYSSGELSYDVVLRGNVIINFEDIDQPHRGTLQGIGCFDGPYRNWVVENNVVITNHWHGITLYGAEQCTVVNNTVFNPWYHDGTTDFRTWVEIHSRKDGVKSVDCVVRNNIAHQIRVWSSQNENATVENNLAIDRADDPDAWFVDIDAFDLHLVDASPAIDAGTAAGAPALDADQLVRWIGPPDCGAYEWGAVPPTVADAGPDQTVVDTDGDGYEPVVMDASGTYSLLSPILDYFWTVDGLVHGAGADATVMAPLGETTYTLEAVTESDGILLDTVVVTVVALTPGDADGDGDVDLNDFVILKTHFGLESGATRADGDADGDGDVDLNDFVILKNNFGA